MEMIKAYRRGMCKSRNQFSMYWDGVGIIHFERKKEECSQKIRIQYGKNIKDFHEEYILLADLEKKLNSISSFQYIFFLDVSDVYMSILYILNRYSHIKKIYEPIIAFKDSIMVFPKLRYNDTCFIKYMLQKQTGKYKLLWASKVEGCVEYV